MASQTALYNVNIDNVFNQFVAVGAATRSAISIDGTVWTQVTLTGFPATLTSLTYGNGLAVATGESVNTSNMIWRAGTPTIVGNQGWVAATAAATGIANIGWQGIAFGNNIFCAVGGGINTTIRTTSTVTLTSTNTATWTLNSGVLTAADWRCICYAESKFVTLSYGSNLARYSSDGVTWSNGSGLPIGKWKSIAYNESLSRFVAVSIMPVRVNSFNATTIAFTSGTKRLTRASGNFTTDTYFVGGKIVISGTVSNNGTYTISAVSTTTMDVTEAIVTEAANASAVVTPIWGSVYSDDGITWTVGSPTTPLDPENWNSVTSTNNRFVTVSNSANSNLAAYSTDGINWTSTSLPVKPVNGWSCCAYSPLNGRIVALSTTGSGALGFSDDNGSTWKLGPTTGLAFPWTAVAWCAFPPHSGDTLTIDRGAVITVNTDQAIGWASIPITNGKLLVTNSSTSTGIRFVTTRTSGATVQAITPANGLGEIEIVGDWIEIGTGDNTSNQVMTVPYTDYIPCLWVETGSGTGVYEIWLNVSGAYGGTLRQYPDGLLDVSTGQRGKFFVQTPSATQDKYITATATVIVGWYTLTLNSTTGIFQGASIVGSGIPASTVIEKIIDGTTLKINQLPTASFTNITVRIINPYSHQFQNTVSFGDGVNGNKIATGVKVRCPNIMLTADVPANLHTSSSQLGMSFVLTNGGKVSMDTCLFDEAYHNFNQTQSLSIIDTGMHIRPAITEVYDLEIDGFGLGMPAARRFNNANIWQGRDQRDILTNSLLMNFITGAIINDLVMVVQSPHAVNGGTITAPIGMLNLANSDDLTVSNVRMYSLNSTRSFQSGLAFTAPVTNSSFTNIENYGTPMMSLQLSSNNTFTNLVNSESMFSHSHNYIAGTRVTFDPNTGADMVSGTKYYFKSRTFFTRDRTEYTESRVYSATPFKGSEFFPDYITAYLVAPQLVAFGWTHRTPNYTAQTSPLANADAKNFIEIYRGTSPGFTKNLAAKVAGLNIAPSISVPTVITWASDARTLTLRNITVNASGGRTMTFDDTTKTITASSGDFTTEFFAVGDKVKITGTSSNNSTFTITNIATTVLTVSETPTDEATSSSAVLKVDKITASSGSFITDGYSVGDKLVIRGSDTSTNNSTFTISGVTATIINVTEALTTQPTYSGNLSIIAKYVPTPKIRLVAAGGRTLKFDGVTATASGSRTFAFGGTVALPSTAPKFTAGARTITFNRSASTIVCSSGSFVTDGFLSGDRIYISGTTSNNTIPGNFFTLSDVSASTLTVTAASDLLTDEIGNATGIISAIRTTISCSSGSFITDGFINGVNDRIFVSGTTDNNTTGGNFLTIIAVAATMLTCSGDIVLPEASTTAVIRANRLTASTGSFVTDGYAIGDIIEVTGSANANNNRTFTAIFVGATNINFIEDTTTQAAEASGATLTVKIVPSPKVVYLNSSPNREIAFQNSVAQAATTTRIMTFNGSAKTITSSGTVPGNFISEGFVIGDKVVVTNTTLNNKFTLTLTAVTATVLTASSTLEQQFNEISTTATLTANRIKVTNGTTLGPLVADGWVIGDTVTVVGTSSNNGTYNINNVVTLAAGGSILAVTNTLTNETLSYKTGAVIIANKMLSRQQIYGTAARTFAITSGAKTITLSSGSMLQDGYIAGDTVLVNGMLADCNGIYVISTLTATILTFLGPAATLTYTSGANTLTWNHQGQRPFFTTTASITLVWTAATKTLTLATNTWDATYNVRVGDKIFITGQRYNNGIFTVATVSGFTLTVTEPVTVDTTTYNNTNVASVIAYRPTAKVTITAAAARVMTFSMAGKSITLSGASAGSFILDGYVVGDCIQIAGTASGINDGYFTIAALTATVMNVNEIININGTGTTVVENSGATISAPNIANETDYYYVLRKYDNTGVYNDSEEIYVRSTFQEHNTNICLKGTALSTTEWTASGITVGAATRISPFVSTFATQTAEALVCTTTADGGTLTQVVPTSITSSYVFTLWVCTQPTILKLATLTAAVGRTLKFDSKNITRTVTFNAGAKTIVAGASDFTTDFNVGDKITITGTASNNTTYTIVTVVALTITVNETPVNEVGISATIRSQKLTASTGSFITDGYQIGDRVLTAGATAAQNNGWFTVTNVVATILNFSETVVTEAAYSATLTITDFFNDTLSIGGSIAFGTTTTAFTATAQWQKITATFTATATTTNAVITITDNRRAICIIGATINLGSTALPYLTTTTIPVSNSNKVRDISLVRAWCRGYGEAESHSGVEIQLAAAVTGELWTEVYCGTTSGFTPSVINKVFDTFAGSGNTIIFNQASQNNTIDNFDQVGVGAATNYTLAYFAAVSSGNKIKNLTYNLGGTYMTGLAAFLTQSNDMLFYNWNIDNWRNYATTVGNAMIFTSSNATSGLTVENLIFNNSDFPMQNLLLNCVVKGMSAGNVKPLNSALLNNMPVTPVYVLGGGATNFDSIATTVPTVYTTVYDTIFNELYFTSTTGALSIVFNASAKTVKPYILGGTANFSNNGRLYFINAGDYIEYTWPHTIIGVSGFRNIPFLLNGVDLGNTPSLLEGLLIEYKIDTGSGYPGSWTTATPANLSAETVSATTGFNLKIKITAKLGMKYAVAQKNFVIGETIKGISSLATAVVDNDFDLITQGTLWLSGLTGEFSPGELIIKESNGELRATNVATNAAFGVFPSFTSYIDGLQIYTNVDQSALYPPERQTLSLTGLKPNSEVRIYEAGTTTQLAGIENSGTTFDYEYLYVPATYVDIVILHLEWNYYKIKNYILSENGASIPIAQITDRVYNNA